MSTNDRRTIAGELRRKANDSLDGESLQRALARIVGAEDSSWRGVMRRLADLIDRPTCTFYGTPERIGYVCSNCGQTFTRRPLMSHAFGNDTHVEISFRFCPYCCAEVVTDDE